MRRCSFEHTFPQGRDTALYITRRKELENRQLIKDQALGETFDSDTLDRRARYETHLDRKLERTLAMLIRLQDLRCRTADT